MSIGCKIVKDFQRPAPELVTRFKDKVGRAKRS